MACVRGHSSPGRHDVPSAEGRHSLLEQVLPALLRHLGAREKLVLFRSSKALAHLVLKEAPNTSLSLALHEIFFIEKTLLKYEIEGYSSSEEEEDSSDTAEDGETTNGNCSEASDEGDEDSDDVPKRLPVPRPGSTREYAQRLEKDLKLAYAEVNTVFDLVSDASSLSVTMDQGITFVPLSCYTSITSVFLSSVELPRTALSSHVPLHLLPRLHTLRLKDCNLPFQGAIRPAAPDGVTSGLARGVRTLECAHHKDCSGLFRMVLGCIDPAQVQKLIVSDNASVKFLAQLPNVTEVHLLPLGRECVSYNSHHCTMDVNDEAVRQLLAHKGLKTVVLSRLHLKQSHAGQAPCWDSLRLQGPTSLENIARLPLKTVKSCIMESGIFVEGPGLTAHTFHDAMRNLEECTDLVFQPAEPQSGCRWFPSEVLFELDFGPFTSLQQAPLIALVLKHLAPHSTLTLAGPLSRLTATSQLRSCLAKAPAMDVLCLHDTQVTYEEVFGDSDDDNDDDDDDEEEDVAALEGFTGGLLTALPAQVKRVAIIGRSPHLGRWEARLERLVQGVRRPMQLTLVSDAWKKDSKDFVVEWLRRDKSKVEVDFQLWKHW